MAKNKKSKKDKGPRIGDTKLPPPDALLPKDDSIKITLSLSRQSVDFFKKQGRKQEVPYQRLIRALLDHYTQAAR